MNSENAVRLLLVALSGAAMFGVMFQWLRSGELAAVIDARFLRVALAGPGDDLARTFPVTGDATIASEAHPRLIADDETAISWLSIGWGGVGMLADLASGAALSGFVGALIGSLLGSTLAIGLVVLLVLARDRATMATWRAAHPDC